jgi:hypothetical protein
MSVVLAVDIEAATSSVWLSIASPVCTPTRNRTGAPCGHTSVAKAA